MRYFATAAKGTEPGLRDELRELGFDGVRADRGGVHFEGEPSEGMRACLWSRIAIRVLSPLSSFPAPDERAYYEAVHAIDLEPVLSPKHTLVVSSACRSSRITHTEYLNQLTKDAIVDRVRERHGARPSVDKQNPDVHLFVHLVKDEATLYLDLAGEPLHRRGYRAQSAEAPLKESLAAAVLRYSGWDRETPFVDPMCGSGTLAVEAALWAKNVAPGLSRQRFGFERWASFDDAARATMNELRAEARAAVRDRMPPVLGRDASERALKLARSAARNAAVDVTFAVGALGDFEAPSAGAVVSNPPYGKRLERALDLPRDLARMVDRHPGSHVALLLSAEQPIGRTRRKPAPPREVYNGNIECVVRVWDPKEQAKARGD
jgi:putative N6-adenine-specific DNA methylase